MPVDTTPNPAIVLFFAVLLVLGVIIGASATDRTGLAGGVATAAGTQLHAPGNS